MIGAFGENFPYSNFHDLNLDWIIKVVKDFSERYPELITEINKKINKPVFNPNGNLDDILISNGDGTTRWGTVSAQYADVIIETVNEWMNNHPDVTTTVQDGSISYQKLNNELKYKANKNNSGFISPVYIGDYICSMDYQPSATLRNGDNFITIDSPSRSYATSHHSGLGYAKTFSLPDNERSLNINAEVGHGNSIAFDGTYYYIVPVFMYDAGGESRSSDILVYNTQFSLIDTIECPYRPTGVTYDPIAEKLYIFGQDYQIVTYENSTFSVVTTVDMADIPENIVDDEHTFFQDFAVYNGEFYISSPFHTILHGLITENQYSPVTDSFYVGYVDSANRYILGELEGMEFDANGNLYGIMIINIGYNNQAINAFVVELPVNKAVQTSTTISNPFHMGYNSVTLSESTQTKFYLQLNEIRSLLQLENKIPKCTTANVAIPSGNSISDPYVISIMENITLSIAGAYTCKQFRVEAGIFNIYGDGSSNSLTLTNSSNLIQLMRSGVLMLTGSALNITANNITSNADGNFIGNISNYNGMVIIRNKPLEVNDKILKIGYYNIYAADVYIGETSLTVLNKTFTAYSAMGCIAESSKALRFYIHTPKRIPSNPTVAGTIVARGISGFVDNQSEVFDFTSSSYTMDVVRHDYEVIVTIRKANNEAFANVENNTPIVVTGEITIN